MCHCIVFRINPRADVYLKHHRALRYRATRCTAIALNSFNLEHVFCTIFLEIRFSDFTEPFKVVHENNTLILWTPLLLP